MAPSEQKALEFLKTNELSYQGMSTNTGARKFLVMGRFTEGRFTKKLRFLLQAVQAFICVILGKLLYLASPFLPEKHRETLSSSQGG